jgi:hypothetical protein
MASENKPPHTDIEEITVHCRRSSARQRREHVDYRLATLKDEIAEIMSAGPIGRWSNVPAAFPFNSETVDFNTDGSGTITSWSHLSGRSVQSFAWSMEAPGRIIMRYRLTRFVEQAESVGEPDESPELAPVTFGIEVVVQETEVGAWPALVSEGSDAFDCMRTGLARLEPPLRLVESAADVPPARSLLSRMFSWTRPTRHADA